MKNIIIVSSGLFGIQVYDLISEINMDCIKKHKEAEYNVVGYLTDSKKEMPFFPKMVPCLGDWNNWTPDNDAVYALGIDNPIVKMKAVEALVGKGAVFETLIGPQCLVPRKQISYGEGCIINPYCMKIKSVLGSYVTMWGTMAAQVDMGDYSTTMAFANITDAVIGARAYVDHHGFIAAGNSLGEGAVLEAGAMAVKNVKAGIRAAGIPARKVKN